MLRVRHFRDIFSKVFKCLKMHANTLCGISGISETYFLLISKTASEPTRHLFTSSDTFQNTKTQNDFPDVFQQNWEENQSFSVSHSKISAVTPALLSKETPAAAAWRGCTTSHVLPVLGSDHTEAGKDSPRMTPYAPKPDRIPCVKPEFQSQLEGCWKNTKLAALISLLQGSSTPCTVFSRQLLARIHSLLLLLHLYTQILLQGCTIKLTSNICQEVQKVGLHKED